MAKRVKVPRRIARTTTARIIYQCDRCGRPIWPGKRYTIEADKGTSRNVRRFHLDCPVLR